MSIELASTSNLGQTTCVWYDAVFCAFLPVYNKHLADEYSYNHNMSRVVQDVLWSRDHHNVCQVLFRVNPSKDHHIIAPASARCVSKSAHRPRKYVWCRPFSTPHVVQM